MNPSETQRRLSTPLARPAVWTVEATVGVVLRDIFGQVGVQALIDPSAESQRYDSAESFAGSHKSPREVLEYLEADSGWTFRVNGEGLVECWAPGHSAR